MAGIVWSVPWERIHSVWNPLPVNPVRLDHPHLILDQLQAPTVVNIKNHTEVKAHQTRNRTSIRECPLTAAGGD